MGQQRSVNAKQVEVLNWILGGCPEGVMSGHAHKTTASALQNRGLVAISKRGGVWNAVITEAGRYYAKHGDYPPKTEDTPPLGRVAARPAVTRPRRANEPKSEPPSEAARQLLADLEAGDGTLTIERGTERRYEDLVKAAHRLNLIPEGKLLTIEGGHYSANRVVRLADKPAWMTATLDPIPVADRLVKPHTAIATLKADRQHRLRFKPETRNRALRILNALAKAAEQRGHTVTVPTWQPRARAAPGDLLITITGHPHAIHVTEQPDKVPHTPTARELADSQRPFGPRIPKYDKSPSGRLTLTINGGIMIRQGTFSDTKTIDLANRLPVLLQELELRAADAEERRLERERKQAERQRQWEQIRDEAVTAFREDHRAKVLLRQANAWQQARQLADFLRAMTDHISTLSGQERTDAEAWHAWATEHVVALNPFARPARMPETPEPTAEAIKPFMRGLSPYGPPNW